MLPMPIRRCTCDIKVDVHEKCIPDVHGPDPASCWRPCVCGAVAGAGVTHGRLWPWTGATPVFGTPPTARRTVGMCTAIPPPPGVAPGPSVPCGKAIEPAFRGRLRNRNAGVNVIQGRMDRLGASDHEGSGDGDARRSDGRVDGERWVRRLEAALNGLPARIAGAGATPGRRAASCENTLAAMPHQALWAGGRSSHGPSLYCAAGPWATGATRRCCSCR